MGKSLPCIHPIYISGQVKYNMIKFLNETFYNLNWNNFEISTSDLVNYFDNSLVNLIEFFSNNYFQIYWNDIFTDIVYIERVPMEKSLSPEEIYSIINGAKPLTIEWDIRIWTNDADIPEYKKSEVWLK